MTSIVRGEILKLCRQPATAFWGFAAVPLLAILFKVLLESLVFLHGARGLPQAPDLALSAANALSISGNSVAQLVFAIGIASVFYVEYRFSTWRHLVPRHSRTALWAGKFVTCLIFLTAGLLLAIAGDVAVNVVSRLLNGGANGIPSTTPQSLVALAEAFLIAFLELSVLTAVVSTITMITRSMIAAVMSAFVLAIGTTMLQLYLGTTREVIPLPSTAADVLRGWLSSGGSAYDAASGLAILLAWLVAAAGLGLVAFSRQQLASE